MPDIFKGLQRLLLIQCPQCKGSVQENIPF